MKTQQRPPTKKTLRNPRPTSAPRHLSVPKVTVAPVRPRSSRPRRVSWGVHIVGLATVFLMTYATSVLFSQSMAASERAAAKRALAEKAGLDAQTRILADRVRSLESDRAVTLWVMEHKYQRGLRLTQTPVQAEVATDVR